MTLVENLLRNFLGYDIIDDKLVIDLSFLVDKKFDLDNKEFTLPSLGIVATMVDLGFNISRIEDLNITIDNLGPLGNVTVKQLIEEDITFNAG